MDVRWEGLMRCRGYLLRMESLCLQTSRGGVFTTGRVDNIDESGRIELHSTAISLTNHLTHDNMSQMSLISQVCHTSMSMLEIIPKWNSQVNIRWKYLIRSSRWSVAQPSLQSPDWKSASKHTSDLPGTLGFYPITNAKMSDRGPPLECSPSSMIRPRLWPCRNMQCLSSRKRYRVCESWSGPSYIRWLSSLCTTEEMSVGLPERSRWI